LREKKHQLFGRIDTILRIFLDKDGKVNYDRINENTTVKELLEAVDIFLGGYPLPCDRCEESCCKKAWSVEMDNVCVNRLCKGNAESSLKFVEERLLKKKNYYRDFYQLVLKKDKDCSFVSEDNRCSIYEERPVICRLYVCCDRSFRYNVLRELVGSTYLKALVLEHRMRSKNFTERTIKNYRRNPVLFAADYDASLEKIIQYAEEEGWLDEDEKELLYEVME
jgi:hypothetical protein